MSTTIASFKEALRTSNASAGASFGKADFHVHYPGLDDYEYKGEDALNELSRQLTDNNYRYSVILRHQCFPSKPELKALQKLCPVTTLIPGAELNIFVDALGKKVGKDYFFHCIAAIDPESPDEYDFLISEARKKLTYEGSGDYPSGFRSSITDVARFFRENGAIFIPAHLHQGKSAEKSRSVDDIYDDECFLGFVQSGLFSGLEVRDAATAAFFDGHHRTKENIDIPKAMCLQSSDAHHHKHITERNRYTWVQTETRTYAELVAALSFENRVSLKPVDPNHSRVIGIHIVGSFLQDQWIAFNPAMNFLIGCKGSGKTSVLECLRFVLNSPVPPERQEAVNQHIAYILGSAGFVECLVCRADGTVAVVSRRADSVGRIRVIDEMNQITEFSPQERLPFDVAVLGWHEIEAVADQPRARMTLVDRVEGETEIAELYRNINTEVEQARDLLPAIQRSLKRLDERLRVFWDLQRKRSTLTKLEQGALLDLQRQYEAYVYAESRLQAARDQLPKALENSKAGDTSAFRQLMLPVNLPDNAPHSVSRAHALLQEELASLAKVRGDYSASLSSQVTEIIKKLNFELASAAKNFQSFREGEYTQKTEALTPAEREILSSCIKIIEETRSLAEVEVNCRMLQEEVHGQAAILFELCERICTARDRICSIRSETIDKINSQVETVRIAFQRSANHSSRNEFNSKYQQDGGSFFKLVSPYGKQETYENLRELFNAFKMIDLAEESWKKTSELMWDVRLAEFMSVLDEDDIAISMKVGEAGFIPIQNLSAGQRCTAVFPILLRNSKGPLIIDQPEDNLDNRYIADVIAPDLIKKKRQQQFIATSHNANLVVLTDADLVVHIDSNGKEGLILNRGFFSCSKSGIRQAVLDVLDGGEGALRARQRKYGT